MTKVNEIHLFVDHDTKPLEDSDQFIPSFKAPKNYKKPEAVSEYIDTMAQEFREKAKTLPYLSEFSSGVVLGPDGVVLVHGGALSLLEWFSQAESRLEPDSRYVLVGFDPVGFWESLSSTLAMSGGLLITLSLKGPSASLGLEGIFAVGKDGSKSTVVWSRRLAMM
jgi:hypothetical protein